jgi:hypothetical protein
MRARRWLQSLSLIAVGVVAAGAGAPDRNYRNEAMRVRSFEPPASWQLAPQSSYPRLLALYVNADGGRITLTGQKVPAGTTPSTILAQSRPALERQGMAELKITPDPRDPGRIALEATFDGGRRLLRQLYIVDGNLGYVVTLVAPQSRASTMLRDYDVALRSLVIGSGERLDPDGGVIR